MLLLSHSRCTFTSQQRSCVRRIDDAFLTRDYALQALAITLLFTTWNSMEHAYAPNIEIRLAHSTQRVSTLEDQVSIEPTPSKIHKPH